MSLEKSYLFCPVCLERDPVKIPPRYPRCKGFHGSLVNPHGAFRLDDPIPSLHADDHSAPHGSSCLISSHEFVEIPLLDIQPYNHDTSLLTFELSGHPDQPLGLPVCTHLLIRVPGKEHDGSDAVRAYTAVSDPDVLGKFQIMVKRYASWGDPKFAHSYKPEGVVSNFLHQLRIGDRVQFKHNFSRQVRLVFPFSGINTLTMVCVGVGVAPMVHTLHHMLRNQDDRTQIVLIYGNRSVADILQRERLEDWASQFPDRLRLVLAVGSRFANVRMHLDTCPKKCKQVHPAQLPDGWEQLNGPFEKELGWVNETVLRKHAFPPAADTRVFVCGLPGVYDAICGPRNMPLQLGSFLHNIGFTNDMVVKF